MSKEKVQSSAFRWLDIPNNDLEQYSSMCFPKLKGLQQSMWFDSPTFPCRLLARVWGNMVVKAGAGRGPV